MAGRWSTALICSVNSLSQQKTKFATTRRNPTQPDRAAGTMGWGWGLRGPVSGAGRGGALVRPAEEDLVVDLRQLLLPPVRGASGEDRRVRGTRPRGPAMHTTGSLREFVDGIPGKHHIPNKTPESSVPIGREKTNPHFPRTYHTIPYLR